MKEPEVEVVVSGRGSMADEYAFDADYVGHFLKGDHRPPMSGEPAIVRLTITAEFADGSVQEFTADRPHSAVLTVEPRWPAHLDPGTLDLSRIPVSGRGAVRLQFRLGDGTGSGSATEPAPARRRNRLRLGGRR